MRVFWGLPHMGWRSVRDSRTLSKLMCGIGKVQGCAQTRPTHVHSVHVPSNCMRPNKISELQLHLPSFGRRKSTRITRGGGRNYRDETMKPPWLQQPYPLYLHYLALSCAQTRPAICCCT